MTDTHVLMQHAETGGTAYFAPGAVDLWRPKGWTPVDELAAAEAAPKSDAEQAATADEPATKAPTKKRGTDNEEKP